ncbi:hypothetical protein CUZ56_01376 [Saezia sanguinis]|uniref:DUF6094 domain-containing protein n=1 Tax=Saezia sanguinis TaxID=1965230 RepID=A0A433SFA9_9BURK|nr:hypothetical protein CUZ56_01376 [Saezia sanguinis]
MTLMHPRVAHNFAREGYYPTDDESVRRISLLLKPASGTIRYLDPCAGTGLALAQLSVSLECERSETYAVEYDKTRADTARTLVDKCLQSDLMDTLITAQSFSCLFLNPPYGVLPRGEYNNFSYEAKGTPRLEKIFYRRTFSLLQYEGILILIIPFTSLDDEYVSWLTSHFTDIRAFRAVETKFRQVVIFGRRVRSKDHESAKTKLARKLLLDIGSGQVVPDELPSVHTEECYVLPVAHSDVKDFFRVSMEPDLFESEINALHGLWPDFYTHLGVAQSVIRRPAASLSDWHLCLALAAGAISGPIFSGKTGRALVVRGSTHKAKKSKLEILEDEDGNITETRTNIDIFVPIIKAWDMTPTSPTFGLVLTISSGTSATATDIPVQNAPDHVNQPVTDSLPPMRFISQEPFKLGQLLLTNSVHDFVQKQRLNPTPYIQRYLNGDWGEMCDEDKQLNEQVLKNGGVAKAGRLFASYDLPKPLGDETKIWIITNVADYDENDNPVITTTILFPSEY